MSSKEVEKYRAGVVEQAHGLVLEIGFGSGLNLQYFKNISKLYALDPSLELFNLARDRIAHVSFPVEYIQVSAENIPLDEASVDCVVSTWSLCSIPHPDRALKEIHRVLKPGGKFIFIEHGISPKNFTASIQRFLTPVSKTLVGGCHMDRDIETIVKNAGFKIQKIDMFPQTSKPLTFMYKGIAFT